MSDSNYYEWHVQASQPAGVYPLQHCMTPAQGVSKTATDLLNKEHELQLEGHTCRILFDGTMQIGSPNSDYPVAHPLQVVQSTGWINNQDARRLHAANLSIPLLLNSSNVRETRGYAYNQVRHPA